MTSFNLIGAEDNILSTSRTDGEATSFYTYTKDIRESTGNIIGKDGQSEVSYVYDEYGETTEYQSDADDPFKVVKAAKTGYKAYKASKYTKKAVSTTKKVASKGMLKEHQEMFTHL